MHYHLQNRSKHTIRRRIYETGAAVPKQPANRRRLYLPFRRVRFMQSPVPRSETALWRVHVRRHLLQTKTNGPLLQIVRVHFDFNAVSDADADKILAQLSRQARQEFMLIVI